MKIERLLNLQQIKGAFKLLEIGTGSGGIAHYFATHKTLNCKVIATDVIDQRVIKEGYCFVETKDKTLPFTDEYFDVIISNHVIEHVGEESDQLHHLCEIYRLLKPNGKAYLAVPNRWMIIEPHYRLAILSWLPRRLRSSYLKLRGRGEFYDCEPLSLTELDALLARSGFIWKHVEVDAIRAIFEIEGKHGIVSKIVSKLPDTILNRLRPIIPTLICILEKKRKASEYG